jgi:hypothetical protein
MFNELYISQFGRGRNAISNPEVKSAFSQNKTSKISWSIPWRFRGGNHPSKQYEDFLALFSEGRFIKLIFLKSFKIHENSEANPIESAIRRLKKQRLFLKKIH